ncbi:hypothetical protein OPV22_000293 [Ensete ventricosum]|uniref:Uncharacterized protein n=1 Tax=Ensete ventricosum TaxID=4639 RepID=A0AAV8RVE0_ENSVE|nr:hypothetical protein OPV22_000293 [Ensete ventricosum]RWW27778.1 hypothetical protein GW17_00007776 [Ensete ventricosum]RWW74933.1 hypothetical protein BHE74_00017115 [Ensete ventricosum]RZS00799.1 hypothetical protein BHM03_00030569 [Ensete ventricosum]
MTSSSFPSVALWALILVVAFLSPASTSHLSQDDDTVAAYVCRRQYHHRAASSSSLLRGLPSWCLRPRPGQLQPPPQPPPGEEEEEEVDPRYGVEKRFVPTGPNPLHN